MPVSQQFQNLMNATRKGDIARVKEILNETTFKNDIFSDPTINPFYLAITTSNLALINFFLAHRLFTTLPVSQKASLIRLWVKECFEIASAKHNYLTIDLKPSSPLVFEIKNALNCTIRLTHMLDVWENLKPSIRDSAADINLSPSILRLRANIRLSSVYVFQQQFDQAFLALIEALNISKKLNNQERIDYYQADIYLRLGSVAFTQTNLPLAEHFLEKSVEICLKNSYDNFLEKVMNVQLEVSNAKKAALGEQVNSLFIPKIIDLGFILKDVPHDGNCFFHAACEQLILNKRIGFSADTIRGMTIDHILKNKSHYENFIWETDFDSYIAEQRKSSTWADHTLIQAFSRTFNVNIVIVPIDSEKQPFAMRLPQAKETLYFGYLTGLHYMSMVKKPEMQNGLLPYLEAAVIDGFVEKDHSLSFNLSSSLFAPGNAVTSTTLVSQANPTPAYNGK